MGCLPELLVIGNCGTTEYSINIEKVEKKRTISSAPLIFFIEDRNTSLFHIPEILFLSAASQPALRRLIS